MTICILGCHQSPEGNPDGTNVGDVIINGRGYVVLPPDGTLFFYSGLMRQPNMQLTDAGGQLAVATFLPASAAFKGDTEYLRKPDWVQKTTHVYTVKRPDGKTEERSFNYQLDGREKKFEINGQEFGMANGKLFVVVIDDESRLDVKQYDYDLEPYDGKIAQKFGTYFPKGVRPK